MVIVYSIIIAVLKMKILFIYYRTYVQRKRIVKCNNVYQGIFCEGYEIFTYSKQVSTYFTCIRGNNCVHIVKPSQVCRRVRCTRMKLLSAKTLKKNKRRGRVRWFLTNPRGTVHTITHRHTYICTRVCVNVKLKNGVCIGLLAVIFYRADVIEHKCRVERTNVYYYSSQPIG